MNGGCVNNASSSFNQQNIHHNSLNHRMPRKNIREMVGGCCVCADESGWAENPLVYCDGQGCNVAVHQACYGIVQVPSGPWFCRKCESQERAARVRCELCPNRDGALKRTDTNSWAHVVCALYIPEVRFHNVSTMEPIVLGLVPPERYGNLCYLCAQQGRENKATTGATMQCNKPGCKQNFHVTCAQSAGLLCEEAGNYQDNVKYCGYCDYHYQRINKKMIKTIPAYRPIHDASSPETSPEKKKTSGGSDGLHQADRNVLSGTGGPSVVSGGHPSAAASAAQARAGSSPESPSSSSNDNSSNRKGKKGRRPNSAASHGSDHHQNLHSSSSVPQQHQFHEKIANSLDSSSANLKNSSKFHEKIANSSSSDHNINHSDNNKVPNNVEQSPTSASSCSAVNTSSSSSSSSSSKQSSTSSLIDANLPSPDAPHNSGDNKTNHHLESDKVAPVIVKLAKTDDGVYYKKKDESRFHEKNHSNTQHQESSKNNGGKFENENSNSIKAEPMDTESSNVSVSLSNKTTNSSKVDVINMMSNSNGLNITNVNNKNLRENQQQLANDLSKQTTNKSTLSTSVSSSSVSVSLTTMSSSSNSNSAPHPNSTSTNQIATDLSKKSASSTSHSGNAASNNSRESAYDFSLSNEQHTLGENLSIRKGDSPAKIIPLSTNSSSSISNSSSNHHHHGKPLKIDIQANIANTSERSFSPSKRPSDGPNSPTKSSGPRMSKTGKRIGRPPKKGTLIANSSLGAMASEASTSIDNNTTKDRNTPSSSPEPEDFAAKRRKTGLSSSSSSSKRLTNGASSSGDGNTAMMWMMGATLNTTSSAAAKEMDMVLKSEIATHAAYETRPSYHGCPLPGKKQRSSSSTTASQGSGEGGSSSKAAQPQTLEELLERQWEQGSQFLMEQASHFDIASLLSSLHQLKEENVDLKESVDRYAQRRDHLLAVRARLMALNNLTTPPPAPAQPAASTAASATPGGPPPSTPTGAPTPSATPGSAPSSTGTTPDRTMMNGPSPASVSHGPSPASIHGGRGPSPASGRNSTHVSPRNSAATVSPIRVDRGGNRILPPEAPSSSTSSSAVMISPRIQMHAHRGSLEAPHPPVSIAGGHPPVSMSQRGLPPPPVSIAGGPPGTNLPPPAHSPRQLTSPRDQRLGPNPRSSPRGFGGHGPPPPPMENGDYIPVSGLPPHSRPAPHQLLTVVSSSGAGTIAHPGHAGGGGPSSMQRGLPLPPPRQSSYAPMPPVSHHAMRAGQHGGPPPPHGGHGGPPPSHGGLPPPPTRPTAAALIGRPPMSHAFPGANPGSHHYMMDRRGGPGGLHPDKR